TARIVIHRNNRNAVAFLANDFVLRQERGWNGLRVFVALGFFLLGLLQQIVLFGLERFDLRVERAFLRLGGFVGFFRFLVFALDAFHDRQNFVFGFHHRVFGGFDFFEHGFVSVVAFQRI